MPKIVLDADWSPVKKAITSITTDLKTLSRGQAIALFDKESQNFLKGAAKQAIGAINDSIKASVREVEKLNQELRKEKLSTDEIAKKNQQILDQYRKMAGMAKDRAELQETIKGKFGTSMMQGLSNIPALGGLMNLMRAGGPASIAGLALGGGIAAAGMYAMGRVNKGYQQYSEGLQSRVALQRMGVAGGGDASMALGRFGYSPEESRQLQLQSARIFGTGGGSPGAVGKHAMFARHFGTETGDVLSAASGLRGQFGTAQASKIFANIQGAAIAENIDKSQISSYLQTASQMLTQINSEGLGFNTDSISALTRLMKAGMSPEKAAQMISGLHAAISGSTGERNAFFQAAFGSAGMGGGTLGGTREAVQLGLTGADTKSMLKQGFLTKNQADQYNAAGIGGGRGHIGRVFQGIKNIMPEFGGPEGEIQKGLFLQQQFGTKSGAEALKIFNLMEKIQQGPAGGASYDQAMKELKDTFKTDQEKQLELAGRGANALEELGKTAAPALNTIQSAVVHIDEMLSKVLGFEVVSSKVSTTDLASNPKFIDSAMANFKNMTPEEQEAEMSRVKAAISKKTKLANRPADRFLDQVSTAFGGPVGAANREAMNYAELLVEMKKMVRSMQSVDRKTGRASGGAKTRK